MLKGSASRCGDLKENVPHRLRRFRATLLEKTHHWDGALRVHNLVQLPGSSLCSLYMFKEVISQLPAPATLAATYCHALCHKGCLFFQTISQNKLFISKMDLVMVFYHSHIKVSIHQEYRKTFKHICT